MAIHDAFKSLALNEDAEEQLQLVYYLFKRANLKWHLFKREAVLMEITYRRFKRPNGVRWVAHQSVVLAAFIVNLDLLLAYLNNQIAYPYNATTKKEVPRLQGILSTCSNLVTLVFQAAKLDILNLIKPTSLILQSTDLLLPEAVTTITVTVKKVKKLLTKLEEKEVDVLRNEVWFPTLNGKFVPCIEFYTSSSSLGRIGQDPTQDGVTMYSGYTLHNGDIEKALEKIFHDLQSLILSVLVEALNNRPSFITEEPVFLAAAKLLDSTAYKNLKEEDLLKACETLMEHFQKPLEENGFIKARLR